MLSQSIKTSASNFTVLLHRSKRDRVKMQSHPSPSVSHSEFIANLFHTRLPFDCYDYHLKIIFLFLYQALLPQHRERILRASIDR